MFNQIYWNIEKKIANLRSTKLEIFPNLLTKNQYNRGMWLYKIHADINEYSLDYLYDSACNISWQTPHIHVFTASCCWRSMMLVYLVHIYTMTKWRRVKNKRHDKHVNLTHVCTPTKWFTSTLHESFINCRLFLKHLFCTTSSREYHKKSHTND